MNLRAYRCIAILIDLFGLFHPPPNDWFFRNKYETSYVNAFLIDAMNGNSNAVEPYKQSIWKCKMQIAVKHLNYKKEEMPLFVSTGICFSLSSISIGSSSAILSQIKYGNNDVLVRCISKNLTFELLLFQRAFYLSIFQHADTIDATIRSYRLTFISILFWNVAHTFNFKLNSKRFICLNETKKSIFMFIFLEFVFSNPKKEPLKFMGRYYFGFSKCNASNFTETLRVQLSFINSIAARWFYSHSYSLLFVTLSAGEKRVATTITSRDHFSMIPTISIKHKWTHSTKIYNVKVISFAVAQVTEIIKIFQIECVNEICSWFLTSIEP